MARFGLIWRRLTRRWPMVLCIGLMFASMDVRAVSAQRLAFRSYGSAEGLTSLTGACLVQVTGTYLLACSEHGVFTYDGRRFRNLGPDQGLDDGGVVEDLALTKSGRVAVRFPDRVFVSEQAVTAERPPISASFRAVDLRGASLATSLPHQLATTSTDDLALIVGRRTVRLALSASGTKPFLEPFGYSRAEQAELDGPSAIFSVDGKLWETFEDGRICSADPKRVRCFGRPDKLSAGPWYDVVAGSAGAVLARSAAAMATIEPATGSVTEEVLPDQGGAYLNYRSVLGLFHTPSGELATQSAHGLLVKRADWVELTKSNGVPSGTIAAVLSDSDGQLWVRIFGRGVFRAIGYGRWENLQSDDGLSEGVTWQTARAKDGTLFVSTDTGVDEVRRAGGGPHVVKVFTGPAYALAVAADGRVWSDVNSTGALVIDPKSQSIQSVTSPPILAMSAEAGRMWLATKAGLYHVDARADPRVDARADPRVDARADARVDARADARLVAVPDGRACSPVIGVLADGSGGAWSLCEGRLWHRRADGSLVRAIGEWPRGEFYPLAMVLGSAGHLWIGGSGGLYDLMLSGDRVVSITSVGEDDLRTNDVVALLFDRRHWVWAGTDRGTSVFDGRTWVSVDQSVGLVWDDVSQGGLSQDPDGSIWIATSQGLSHLLDPETLFEDHPLRVSISETKLGGKLLPRVGRLTYSTAPLLFRFGTFNYGSERAVVFHYRMSGVDDGWAESPSGYARYPYVPPGHHLLTVVGIDTLRHTKSAPVTVTIDMAYPPWRSWWAEIAYAIGTLVCLQVVLQARARAMLRGQLNKQHELEALVEERTREMRLAQAELRRQATLDGLTGLFNRWELQTRVTERLRSGMDATLLALVDIDHFKKINDGYGHLVGDDVLRIIGHRVACVLGADDFAGRYGGEELLLVLDDADGRASDRLARFHQSVRGQPFDVGCGQVAVTCSIGTAREAPGDDWATIIGRADAALYRAKRSGRDRIGASPQTPPKAGAFGNQYSMSCGSGAAGPAGFGAEPQGFDR